MLLTLARVVALARDDFNPGMFDNGRSGKKAAAHLPDHRLDYHLFRVTMNDAHEVPLTQEQANAAGTPPIINPPREVELPYLIPVGVMFRYLAFVGHVLEVTGDVFAYLPAEAAATKWAADAHWRAHVAGAIRRGKGLPVYEPTGISAMTSMTAQDPRAVADALSSMGIGAPGDALAETLRKVAAVREAQARDPIGVEEALFKAGQEWAARRPPVPAPSLEETAAKIVRKRDSEREGE